MVSDNPNKETEVEAFLVQAQADGSESVRLAAGRLLSFFRSQYTDSCPPGKQSSSSASHISDHNSIHEIKERRLHGDLRQLLSFLGNAKKRGRSAWKVARDSVSEFIQKYPEFHKVMPKHYASVSFLTPDDSWSVIVTCEAASPYYEIKTCPAIE